jgi:hypothetical protein
MAWLNAAGLPLYFCGGAVLGTAGIWVGMGALSFSGAGGLVDYR